MAASALLRSSGSSVASSSNISKIPPFVGFMARRQYNHFHFHGKGDASQAASEAKCHYCQLEAFSTHKDFAVSIVFTRGETRLIPKDFQFIEDVVLTEGVQLAESQFLSGCKCVDEYDCWSKVANAWVISRSMATRLMPTMLLVIVKAVFEVTC